MKSLKAILLSLKNLFPFLRKQQQTEIIASMGDIRKYTGDAVVNAANSQLMAGGGVCGAIFEAAGHAKLQAACNSLGVCPTGSAMTTPAFNLPSKHIIHAVGPIYEEGQDNATLLGGAYWSSLSEAVRVGARSIAFPAISTGIYGYPMEDATKIAIATVKAFCTSNKGCLDRVDFICFSQRDLDIYTKFLVPSTNIDASNSPSI